MISMIAVHWCTVLSVYLPAPWVGSSGCNNKSGFVGDRGGNLERASALDESVELLRLSMTRDAFTTALNSNGAANSTNEQAAIETRVHWLISVQGEA